MAKKEYTFRFTGLSDSGSRISPTTIHKNAETASEAKKLALASFKKNPSRNQSVNLRKHNEEKIICTVHVRTLNRPTLGRTLGRKIFRGIFLY